MRRLVAISLLLLFASAYMLPMVMSDAEQKLPACCRSDGKHHCSMMDKLPRSSDPGFHGLRPKCPGWPVASLSSSRQNLPICTAFLIYSEALSHPAVFFQSEVEYLLSDTRSHLKRGPPSLL